VKELAAAVRARPIEGSREILLGRLNESNRKSDRCALDRLFRYKCETSSCPCCCCRCFKETSKQAAKRQAPRSNATTCHANDQHHDDEQIKGKKDYRSSSSPAGCCLLLLLLLLFRRRLFGERMKQQSNKATIEWLTATKVVIALQYCNDEIKRCLYSSRRSLSWAKARRHIHSFIQHQPPPTRQKPRGAAGPLSSHPILACLLACIIEVRKIWVGAYGFCFD